MRRETRKALNDIGINLPRLDMPVARLSGGQRQAIAVARGVYSDADILLLDEPLAAMGAKEGGRILELIARLKAERKLSMIMILHNYVHVLETCDRVNMIVDGVIALDKPTSETSVDELTEIVVDEYRRARLVAQQEDAAAAANGSSGDDERALPARVNVGADQAVVDVAHAGELLLAQRRERGRGRVRRDLLGVARARDHGADAGLVDHPAQRELRERARPGRAAPAARAPRRGRPRRARPRTSRRRRRPRRGGCSCGGRRARTWCARRSGPRAGRRRAARGR